MNPVMVVRTEVAKDVPQVRSCWFWCPGCDLAHRVRIVLEDGTAPGGDPLWTWDGNLNAPTISPSILTWGGRHGSDHRCHSFLRAGVWEFLSDCTHAMAGQSAPMVPLPDWLADMEDARG